MKESEIKKRLNGVIDRLAVSEDRRRVLRYGVDVLTAEVSKMLDEQKRALTEKPHGKD